MDLATWSPFQSDQVREICAHMTDEERSDAFERSALYGLWILPTFVWPVRLLWNHSSTWSVVLGATLILLHVGMLPWWRRRQKRFLFSTQWARSQGLSPEARPSRLWPWK